MSKTFSSLDPVQCNFLINFVRIPTKKYEAWMKIIKSSYPRGMEIPTTTIVVCDLHFNENDIIKCGERRILAANSIPIIS